MIHYRMIFSFVLLCVCIGYQKESWATHATPLNAIMDQIHHLSPPKLTGLIIFPGEPSYNEARLVSNYYTSKDKFPDVIVYCQTTQDVQNAVRWARYHKIPIRVRSGGHNHEAFSTGTGVIVIDVSHMKQMQIDKTQNIITVQPGITNQELYYQLYQEGLTHVGGTCSGVGLSGLVLSGGIGPLIRRHGLACDSVIYFDIVDANGQMIHATKDNAYQDLFWASCGGGGGNFGIVTSMAIKVYPAESVTWFNIGWDWNQPVEKVFTAWQDFFSKNDKRWFSHLDIWSKPFPSHQLKKQPLKVLGVFWGTPEEAQRELAPLLNIGQPHEETIELVTWEQAIQLIEESTAVFTSSKPEYKTIGAFAMKPLPAEAIEIIHTTLQDTSSPLFNVLLFSLGGAAQEISPTDTAYFYRNAQFFVSYSIEWLKKKNNTKRIRELTNIRQRLLPYAKGDYVGNPDPDFKDYLKIYYGDNVHRLECIKRKYDPHNVFHFQQSIPPAPVIWNCLSN